MVRFGLAVLLALGLFVGGANGANTINALPSINTGTYPLPSSGNPAVATQNLWIEQGTGDYRLTPEQLGYVVQTTCSGIALPAQFQQCIDTSLTTRVLKEYIGTTWWSLYSLNSSTGPGVTAGTAFVDVFLIAGQSNAQGAGDSSLSPQVPAGRVLQVNGSTITTGNDPVGNAATGSAWPAFGLAYAAGSGHVVAFVPSAVGGTPQCAVVNHPNGDWDVSGTLVTAALSNLNTALTTLTAAGYVPVFKGLLWDQGESDGTAIAANIPAGYVGATYFACLQAMVARFRAATIGGAVYPQMPFFISQTGLYNTGMADPNNAGLAEIAYQQYLLTQSDPYSVIAFSGAADFAVLGLMNGANLPHYTQSGYNIMGGAMAQSALSYGEIKRKAPSIVPVFFNSNGVFGNGSGGPNDYRVGRLSLLPVGSETTAQLDITPNATTVVKNLQVSIPGTPGAGNSITVAFYRPGVGVSALTCTISDAASSCSDTSYNGPSGVTGHQVLLTGGQGYGLDVVFSNGANSNPINASVEFEVYPDN